MLDTTSSTGNEDPTLNESVTFERMRCQANNGNLYSVHKQLTWANQKAMRQYERDYGVTSYNLNREKSLMRCRLAKLKEIQKRNFVKRNSDPSLGHEHHSSEPILKIEGIMKPMSYHGPPHSKEHVPPSGSSTKIHMTGTIRNVKTKPVPKFTAHNHIKVGSGVPLGTTTSERIVSRPQHTDA